MRKNNIKRSKIHPKEFKDEEEGKLQEKKEHNEGGGAGEEEEKHGKSNKLKGQNEIADTKSNIFFIINTKK